MEPGACVLSETVTEDGLNCGRPLYGQTDSLSPGLSLNSELDVH